MSAVGLWTRALDTLTVAAANDAVAEFDTQGWHSLWFAENPGREAFVNASLMLGWSTTLTIATGIANIFARSHSYLVTPDHTRWAREVLGSNKLLAVEQGAVLTTDRKVFRRVAYHRLESYTGLANYRNSWARRGFADTDFVRGGSERLADALLCSGPEEAIARRIHEHHDAGADIVCLQVPGELPGFLAADDIRRLAQALF
jgi:hypothetical protein